MITDWVLGLPLIGDLLNLLPMPTMITWLLLAFLAAYIAVRKERSKWAFIWGGLGCIYMIAMPPKHLQSIEWHERLFGHDKDTRELSQKLRAL